MESKGDMRHVLRTLFKSDFFKAARFKRVKSPAELITGVLKLVGTNRTPTPGMLRFHRAAKVMGQELFNPPTVEGWHTGQEWIDGGMLTERINFAVDEVSDASKPGIRAIIKRLRAAGDSLTPEQFVDSCLDLAGPVNLEDKTRADLISFAQSGGDLVFSSNGSANGETDESTDRIVLMLQLIVASREYQFA